MSLSYNPSIPSANDYPGDDQGPMQTNFASINTWTAVDHFQFSNTNAGQHQIITMPANITPSTPVGTTASVIYTKLSDTTPTTVNAMLQNSTATYLLSGIKAMGSFLGGSPSTFINQYNCSTISVNGSGYYVINLVSNTTTNNNVIIFVTSSSGLAGPTSHVLNYEFAGNALTINPGGATSSLYTISFAILQF